MGLRVNAHKDRRLIRRYIPDHLSDKTPAVFLRAFLILARRFSAAPVAFLPGAEKLLGICQNLFQISSVLRPLDMNHSGDRDSKKTCCYDRKQDQYSPI